MREDKEVRLVNLLILDLNQVVDEMEVVEKNDYYEVVLEAKLLKLMKSYGESLCLGTTMNVYRSHYKYVLKQREKKEDKEVKYIMKITCTYKTYSLDIIKEENSDYFKCILIGDAYSTPQKISNESLEKVLHIYRCHIDSFNIGVLGHLMELTVKCGERTLDTFKYDPNINKVLGNFLFIVKKGEEGSLDKLVVSFQEEVDKENRSITFKYKGFVLRLGLVDNSYGITKQGGHCEELNYKTFGKSREKDIANFKSYINNHPIGQHKAKEKKKDIPQFKMQFLSTNGEVITLPCHIKEDGSIHCEPFSESATINNYAFRKELYKLNLTTHDLIKILTVDERGIPQFYWTPTKDVSDNPNTYSSNWHIKEGSTYFIYDKPVNIQEIKVDNFVTGFINPEGEAIYYDQYL